MYLSGVAGSFPTLISGLGPTGPTSGNKHGYYNNLWYIIWRGFEGPRKTVMGWLCASIMQGYGENNVLEPGREDFMGPPCTGAAERYFRSAAKTKKM